MSKLDRKIQMDGFIAKTIFQRIRKNLQKMFLKTLSRTTKHVNFYDVATHLTGEMKMTIKFAIYQVSPLADA